MCPFYTQFDGAVHRRNAGIQGNEKSLAPAFYLKRDFEGVGYNYWPDRQVVRTNGCDDEVSGPREDEGAPAAQ